MIHDEIIISLQHVLPSFCFENIFSCIRAAVNFYAGDLPGLRDSIETEYEL